MITLLVLYVFGAQECHVGRSGRPPAAWADRAPAPTGNLLTAEGLAETRHAAESTGSTMITLLVLYAYDAQECRVERTYRPSAARTATSTGREPDWDRSAAARKPDQPRTTLRKGELPMRERTTARPVPVSERDPAGPATAAGVCAGRADRRGAVCGRGRVAGRIGAERDRRDQHRAAHPPGGGLTHARRRHPRGQRRLGGPSWRHGRIAGAGADAGTDAGAGGRAGEHGRIGVGGRS